LPFGCNSKACNQRTDLSNVFVTQAIRAPSCPSFDVIDQSVRVSGTGNIVETTQGVTKNIGPQVPPSPAIKITSTAPPKNKMKEMWEKNKLAIIVVVLVIVAVLMMGDEDEDEGLSKQDIMMAQTAEQNRLQQQALTQRT